MRRADISIKLQKPIPNIIVLALEPELGRATTPKTQVNISETNVGLTLSIEAENISALRAAMNSYLRWINCIITTATTFIAKIKVNDSNSE